MLLKAVGTTIKEYLGDMFSHFKEEIRFRKPQSRTVNSKHRRSIPKRVCGNPKSRHTGQTLGGSGPTSTNFNTQTKSSYANPKPGFETGTADPQAITLQQ